MYEIKDGLGPSKTFSIHSTSGYKINYFSETNDGRFYEYLRENIDDYKYNGKGKINFEIKKVVFKDGDILE
ncbi:MAG: hypothetical protein GY853_09615 [PVC group bacterium]|nr:hypothetical protein [PVC group bacterium]